MCMTVMRGTTRHHLLLGAVLGGVPTPQLAAVALALAEGVGKRTGPMRGIACAVGEVAVAAACVTTVLRKWILLLLLTCPLRKAPVNQMKHRCQIYWTCLSRWTVQLPALPGQ